MRYPIMRLTLWMTLLLAATQAAGQTQLTIYKNDLTLVSETRTVRIGAQQRELIWPAVAARLDPESTHLALTEGGGLTLLEERFLPLPATAVEMLTAYLGQPIAVRIAADEWLEGRLDAIRQGSLVLDQAGAQTLIPYGDDVLVRLPETGLEDPPAPALSWQIAANGGGQRTLTLSYLTAGLSWAAAYFGEVNAAEDALLLSAKATVRNRSGKAFEEAQVTLAAGTVNQVSTPPLPRPAARAAMADEMVMMAAPEPAPEAMADLQFYPLDQPLTIADQRQIQRLLIAPRSIPCERIYRYRSHRQAERISAAIRFRNTTADGLGIPLPAGTWRLYRRTDQGLRFIGADRRPSAASQAEITLELGHAFDLHAEKRILQRRKLSARSEEQQVEIVFTSAKEAGTAQIAVEERIAGGQWEITQSSLPAKRFDANTAHFDVPVPAAGKTRLTYTVVRRW
ncbi:MAG: hypothetical protein QNJ22_14210 [Desulfosarcinaceae bacterium]|nr:hypothetical protein [Desulfosarcinaceae bacterium]